MKVPHDFTITDKALKAIVDLNFKLHCTVQVLGMRDCVVYGVEIPGTEGRAGMAAIPDPERRVDLSSLYAGMVDKLPSYARPIFLRFVEEIDITGINDLVNSIMGI